MKRSGEITCLTSLCKKWRGLIQINDTSQKLVLWKKEEKIFLFDVFIEANPFLISRFSKPLSTINRPLADNDDSVTVENLTLSISNYFDCLAAVRTAFLPLISPKDLLQDLTIS